MLKNRPCFLKTKEFCNEHRPLVLILVLALILRLIAINHGFPFIFHPDEPATVRSATGIRFDPNPGHFDWPHLSFYTNFIVFEIFIKFRALLQILNLRSVLEPVFPILWRDPLVFYYISRIFAAALGAATLIPIYLASKELFNKKAGLIAAALLALAPLHVHTSHFALIDVPMTFFVAFGLYFSARIYTRGGLWNYLLAGLFVGFAASTKYNGGLTAIIVPIAHLLRPIPWKQKISILALRDLTLSGVFSVLGFVIGTPYAIMDFNTFTITDNPKGALWQFSNVGNVSFQKRIIQFLDSIKILSEDLGYIPIIGFLGSLFLAKKNSRIAVLLVSAFMLIFYVAGFEKLRSHYFMMIYPFILVSAGGFISKTLFESKQKWLKWIFVASLVFMFYLCALVIADLWKRDTRQIAYDYLVREGVEKIYFDSSSLIQLAEKFDGKQERDYADLYLLQEDFYFVTTDLEDKDTLMGLDPKQQLVISNDNRRGPDIYVLFFDIVSQ